MSLGDLEISTLIAAVSLREGPPSVGFGRENKAETWGPCHHLSHAVTVFFSFPLLAGAGSGPLPGEVGACFVVMKPMLGRPDSADVSRWERLLHRQGTPFGAERRREPCATS